MTRLRTHNRRALHAERNAAKARAGLVYAALVRQPNGHLIMSPDVSILNRRVQVWLVRTRSGHAFAWIRVWPEDAENAR